MNMDETQKIIYSEDNGKRTLAEVINDADISWLLCSRNVTWTW